MVSDLFESRMETVDGMFYHGTFAPDEIRRFFRFSHFGTRAAALEMLAGRRFLDGSAGVARIYGLQVTGVRLLRVADFDSPEPNVWRSRLRDEGLLTLSEHRDMQRQMFEVGTAIEDRQARCLVVEDWLRTLDCEGFIYVNRHEDKGSDSISLARPERHLSLETEHIDAADIEATWRGLQDAIEQ